MTADEARAVIEFMAMNYPGTFFSDDAKRKMALIWAAEFERKPMSKVMEAFRMASMKSPDRPPSIPRVMAAVSDIESRVVASVQDGEDERERFFSTEEGKAEMERNMERIRKITQSIKENWR